MFLFNDKVIFYLIQNLVVKYFLGKFTTMTDCEILQMLANGYTVIQVSNEKNINRRTLEKRIIILRDRCNAKTVTELVAKYFRLKLIE